MSSDAPTTDEMIRILRECRELVRQAARIRQ